MRRNGIRSCHTESTVLAAARSVGMPLIGLTTVLMLLPGCSSLGGKNESIIKVETQRDTAKANRLTYAGIRALNKHQIDVAAKRFREAVAADYSYGPAHNNLGLMHYEQGNLYQAVLAFEQAREFLPSDPAVAYNLGLALESAGRTDEALELYQIANAMDRANPNYLGNLVRLRVRLGECDEVLEQQLKDLVLIETRADWRRWADTQLALTFNHALDRGPKTPDLESTINDATNPQGVDLQNKIIDLTPVMPASLEEPMDPTPPLPQSQSPPANESELSPLLQEGVIEDLTE